MDRESGYLSVYLPAQPEDNNMVKGVYPPQRVRNEEVDSVNMLLRSEDRSYGNDFDFQSDLLTTSAHIRKIQLAKSFVPLVPQINTHNSSITVTHSTGTVTFSLVPGFYSVQALANMMQAQFTAAWLSLDPANSVTISYDIDKRQISITDDNGLDWYIHTGCPFDLYGRNVVKFPTQAAGSALSAFSFESLSLGMIYSRFYVLTSSRLTEDQKSFSVVSSKGASNIVAILDVASHYSPSQFSVSSSFPGTDIVIDSISYAPRINLLNRDKALKVIDLQIEDEFGFNLSTINTSTYQFVYPTAFFFQCYL